MEKYQNFRKGLLIDGTQKLRNTFESCAIDKLYYIDFYAIERFGKTRLGTMLLLAKQSQSKLFVQRIKTEIDPFIKYLIDHHQINGIAFVPPTVKRELQIMKELKKSFRHLATNIDIIRLKSEIVVPQKSLSKLS